MAQDHDVENAVQKLLEESETEEGLVNPEQMTENLYKLASNPLDINTASEEELSKLYILNSFQVKSLQDYIQTHGKLLTVYELQFVVGFNLTLVKQLMPFITVNHDYDDKRSRKSYSFLKKLEYGKHRFLFRGHRTFQQPAGYRIEKGMDASLPKYKGDIYKLYSKYAFSFDDELSFGLTMEKDP
ncbi:MAG: ComEA family DNA-binding protein, partial [Bacteroidales bacterium]